MKRFLLAITASVAIASGAFAASVSYTNTATASGNGSATTLSLQKFNTSLGDLQGVVVTVSFVTLQGTFDIQSISGDVSVSAAYGQPVLREASTNSLGFTQLGATDFTGYVPVTATPSLPFTINSGSSQTFTVTPKTAFTNNVQTIGTNFWASYKASGAQNMAFQLLNTPFIQTSGGTLTQSVEAFTASSTMSVTYTYDAGPSPIPESSTVVAGAFLTLAAAGTYVRRRSSRATRAS